MWKAIASTALSLFVVVLFLFAGFVTWSVGQWRAPGPLTNAICIEVASGANMRQVAVDLEAQGALSSRVIFNTGVEYSGKAGQLKAGNFLIPAGASMEQILADVTGRGQSTCGTEIVWRIGVTRIQADLREMDPATRRYASLAKWNISAGEAAPALVAEYRARPDTQYRLVLAEGVTSWQVREAVNGIDLLAGQVEAIPAEGSLAPGDYPMAAGDAAAGLIERMQRAQEARLAEIWAERSANAMVQTPEEALILASIIEKETGLAGERFEVASVFTNRLRQGMRLQTDPTVIYGITQGQGVLGRGLRRSELDRVTPWNTYKIDGLPPTPIANPGLESLRAAVNPAQTDFLFFVADGTGGHAFARTLAEHNQNVAKWRAIEAQRSGN